MPRVKVPMLVVTFPTTAAAMACEACCERRGLGGRMIPVPGEISAGCGLAWKVEPEARAELEAALAEDDVPWEEMAVVELLAFRPAAGAGGVAPGASASKGES